jgi:hypothetical protein
MSQLPFLFPFIVLMRCRTLSQRTVTFASTAVTAPPAIRNYKGALKEFCDQHALAQPVYSDTSTGPDNDKRWMVRKDNKSTHAFSLSPSLSLSASLVKPFRSNLTFHAEYSNRRFHAVQLAELAHEQDGRAARRGLASA